MGSDRRFPKVAFGICPKCGGDGGDDSGAGGADVPATDTTGNGYKLLWFRGELMCELCKKELLAREESELDSSFQAEEQEFRDKAGFTRGI